MGLDVTAANVIFFIAFISAGSVALGAYWHNASYIEEARRVENDRAAELAHTNMTIDTVQYNGGQDRFTITAVNQGSTVITISELRYLVDGVLVAQSTVEEVTVVGEPTPTDLWMPLESIQVKLLPITASPTHFQIVTAEGARANWRS